MPRSVSLNEFLKADRQWPRHLRIAHARLMMQADNKEFWKAVLKANGAKA